LKGKKIVIVGLARTGVAAARFLVGRGAEVVITDIKTKEELGQSIEGLKGLDIKYELGGHEVSSFTSADMVLVSPGVPLTIDPIKEAIEAGVEVIGDIELASRYIKAPVLGVTGTNGKSTVTTLLGEVLTKAGKRTYVGGNIGNPLVNAIDEDIDFAVTELSSFQLEAIKTFRPWVSLLLNLAPDHLDRYENVEEYYQAKVRVFKNQGLGDYAVVNWDDQLVKRWVKGVKAELVPYSTREKLDKGVWLEGQIVKVNVPGFIGEVDISSINIPGVHNKENMAAVIATAALCGCTQDTMKKATQEFTGLEHRIEFIRELEGVKWYNDSKATNIDSVRRALESFSGNIIWLAGGRNKGGDFSELIPLIKERVKHAILLGEAKKEIEGQIGGSVSYSVSDTLEDAASEAKKFSGLNDIVLFSPGCASFDMFTDYEDRGRAFKKIARDLDGRK
jgi:UDP-N-acetylmuramoylalanine--D-glutamate ligase